MATRTRTAITRVILLGLPVVILAVFGVSLAGRAIAGSGSVFAQGTPGTETDPLVSKSYVDQLARWRLVTVEAGRTLVASEGTELVLRAGQAKAVASASGGLADVTAGKDLANREVIKANHLLLVPRGDGRGIQAVTQVILLVRGGYGIQ